LQPAHHQDPKNKPNSPPPGVQAESIFGTKAAGDA
jgi:hypothetical protein